MNWKKILAREWLIFLGCICAGLILILIVSIILVANNKNVDGAIIALMAVPFCVVYLSRLVFLFRNSITWAIKTVKGDKSKTSGVADAVIIDAPSLIEAKTQKEKHFKISVAVILWLILLGFIVTALIFSYQNRPSDIVQPAQSTPQPESQSPDFTTLAPVATPLLNRSLPNGTLIQNFIESGSGKLTVENGTSSDAEIRLKSIDESYIFYIQGNHDVVVENVPDGNYQVLYESGEDWDDLSKDFTRNQSFFEFNDSLNFQTTQTEESDGTHEETTIYTLTLHPVLNGNAEKHSISKAEFGR